MTNKLACELEMYDLWERPGFLVRRLHQIQVAMFLDECEAFNITPVQFGVLTTLYDREALDQSSIAAELGVDRVTVADVIRRLERRELLTRSPSAKDKRTRLACITPAGRRLVDSVHPAMVKAQHRFVDPLTPQERQRLMELMRKLVEANGDYSRAPMRANGRMAQK